ncbi:IS607 family transposase [Photobacterium damselae]|uniref:IS607 family transposase n=1 Tax=Photobacterium damselae TaxID=38293 RepID=UPI001EEED58D|nr:IS607 family transposase [Photobacterium damselae]UKA04880.1 IS607 family transposase [Photobacterium damselae subsp. damselae]
MNRSLSIGEAAKILGVSVPTLRRWDKSGKFKSSHRTLGDHRRFSIRDIENLLGITSKTRKIVGYARCSSHDQKADLERQSVRLSEFGCDEVIKDLGSGLNCKKKGLTKLLKMIIGGEIKTLVLTHMDRLIRFGHEIITKLCEWFDTQVHIINNVDDVPFEQQLATDVITLMTVCCARLYGKRSGKNKK